MAKSYLNIDLPPGIRSNGTTYKNRGVWVDGSRVRWDDGAVRPIGGWQVFDVKGVALPPLFSNPAVEVCRAFKSWRANDGTPLFAAGTNLRLFAWNNARPVAADITPTGFTAREKSPIAPSGYGNWYYGTGSYNTERPHDNEDKRAFSWGFNTWGQNLLAAPKGAPSRLYQWDTDFSKKAVEVAGAPADFDCFHVTPQRIVMTAGSPSDPRIVKWSDSENLTDWTPKVDNKAGFQRLEGVGRIRAMVGLQERVVLVSETDVHTATYIGVPFVFSFDKIAENCGTPSPNAVVSNGQFVMWPGHSAFFMFDGATVSHVKCDVMDRFAKSLNYSQASKTVGFVNPFWPEIWWLYQEGGDDIDSYIYYNWQSQHWGYGKLNRTAAGGYSTVGGLIMVSPSGEVFEHEIQGVPPYDDSPAEVFLRSGPIELTTGNTTQYVRSIQPDFGGEGAADVTLFGRDRPSAPVTEFGPYRIGYPASGNQPVAVRARGHTVELQIAGGEGAWTLGSMRLDFATGGEK